MNIYLYCLTFLFIGCASVKPSYIDPDYVKSLIVLKNGSTFLDKADISYCLDFTEKISFYYPQVTFRECLVKRGYILLN